MRSFIVAALFAGLALAAPAVDTVYSTEEITITSCAATVTDCPARSTVVSTTVVAYKTPVANNGGSYSSAPYPTASTAGAVQGAAQASGTVGTVGTAAPSASATGAYQGPVFTGAGNTLNAGMALGGVAAIVALVL